MDGARRDPRAGKTRRQQPASRYRADPADAELPGNPVLKTFINDLQGLLQQRSQQMSQRLLQPGRGGSSEMVDFMLLQLINRHLGQVSHAYHLDHLHPERLFADWLQFATELASFSAQRTPEGRLPVYDHDNLALCFGKLMLLLRQGCRWCWKTTPFS